MTKIGYARVSSTSQRLDRQLVALKQAGVTKIFAEKISGKDTLRPKLQQMLDYIHDDDEVVVVSLDRLGRNSADLTAIIDEIRQSGAVLNILNLPSFEGIKDHTLKALLTNLVFEIQKYTAEMERKQIRERQRQGIKLAKQRGSYKGRQVEYSANSKKPQKRLVYNQIVKQLEKRAQGASLTISSIAKQNGVSRNTVYKIKQQVSFH